MKIFLRVAFFLGTRLFLSATLYKQPKAEVWLECLPNPRNITPFVGWNKQKETAITETHFCGIESKKVL